ncbi:sigma-54 dependent transcriptional regulator [bacterium]|nr:sigma-54 dependent transcriptional regulator [bacterium]
MTSAKILIVDDEENIRFVLSEVLSREGFEPHQAVNGLDAVEKCKAEPFDIVIMDLRMPKLDGMEAMKQIREHNPEVLVLIITAHGTQKTALEAIQNGAYDYFSKPFDLTEVRVVVRRAAEKVRLIRLIHEIREEAQSRYRFDRIVGQSGVMQEVYNLVSRVVDNDVSVLITGESGTGKELVAAAVHYNSPRRDGPFIKVNTVAIPETLLESEMFGHERGSFTGAIQQKIGKVEAADGGTLFLDEIGDMPLPLQAKLLRVLQEREIERVGSTKQIKVDIRVICATNKNLADLVAAGQFREDLYYRINVMPIYLPPIRERKEDIPLLIDHFIQYYNPRLGRTIQGLSQGALAKLLEYPWPGNVRELENMVQRIMLMARGSNITLEDLPPTIHSTPSAASDQRIDQIPEASAFHGLDLSALLCTDDFSTPLAERLTLISDHVEKFLIEAALEKTGGKRQETADLLGISRKSLHNKMVRYGLFDE